MSFEIVGQNEIVLTISFLVTFAKIKLNPL